LILAIAATLCLVWYNSVHQFGHLYWVHASENDCLKTSYPQLIGATDGDTEIHTILLEGSHIYSGGGSTAASITSAGAAMTPFLKKQSAAGKFSEVFVMTY